ncbi:probably inactive receptor-like protein kinase at5g41680 [Phtheirospermum japonicum]|uniref:Probably inactive receptor-like protein kinase at5g41680 n=1 Tax=Phtheirospermum japonicum TaxID=374723 RepID=A0A830BY56_9LAMI|nr:probably inactive receptor-like protein kinase at5g41680 [Phtheirospermum japonicum]
MCMEANRIPHLSCAQRRHGRRLIKCRKSGMVPPRIGHSLIKCRKIRPAKSHHRASPTMVLDPDLAVDSRRHGRQFPQVVCGGTRSDELANIMGDRDACFCGGGRNDGLQRARGGDSGDDMQKL